MTGTACLRSTLRFIESRRVVFLEENQCVVYCGLAAGGDAKSNTESFQRVDLNNSGIEWHPERDSCSTFLMAICHASFGVRGSISPLSRWKRKQPAKYSTGRGNSRVKSIPFELTRNQGESRAS